MENPLAGYRRTQRELRRHFDQFTRSNCPSCPTPCCRKPAQVGPVDILLAEAAGWKARVNCGSAGERDVVGQAASELYDALTSAEIEGAGEPCDFLAEDGCTFPDDLRPFGCTTFICRYMIERMDRVELQRVRGLVRELREKRQALMRSLSSR